ncbi:MAG: SRPBCC family protein [Thermomicrobiales bacterium]
MKEVTKSIDVSVPARVAYNQWTQFEDFPKFMEHVERVEQVDDSTIRWFVTIDGNEQQWTSDVTEQVPDQRIAWNSVEGAKNAGVVTFHRLDEDTTRVTVQLEYDTDGLVERVGAALGFMDRNLEDDLERFREFIESRGHETGAWRGEVEQTVS